MDSLSSEYVIGACGGINLSSEYVIGACGGISLSSEYVIGAWVVSRYMMQEHNTERLTMTLSNVLHRFFSL